MYRHSPGHALLIYPSLHILHTLHGFSGLTNGTALPFVENISFLRVLQAPAKANAVCGLATEHVNHQALLASDRLCLLPQNYWSLFLPSQGDNLSTMLTYLKATPSET